MSDQPLTGKMALVTGASRGIGRAIALRLARKGAEVGLHYATGVQEAERVRLEIEAAGGRAWSVQGDLGTAAGVEAVAAAAAARGPLDILVNNAGRQIPEGPAADEAAFDYIMAVNAKAAFFLVQKLQTVLRDGGRIVNVSSGLSQTGFPDKMVYGMAKAAMNGMTLSFAALLGPRGITVNAVLPGMIASDMNPWLRSPEGAARAAAMSVFRRVGQPDDVAAVVDFLVSDDAAWITGELIAANGGVRFARP